ncbi:ABC transporter ATP-binding protein [Bradyrhizobium sp. 23]|uniref:ABC transporter ATP-binding protein n=1 Tax=Bradyrhizobium sp. 23 TaxID=2782667 RepID=UPI001FFBE92A|nr:ABC transporter ATP-binding protein [Bradyrhizobium sp. 23]MCK1315462.1 ABC transporter ATP-binding protein [Bradyrhizobium sp. 23]
MLELVDVNTYYGDSHILQGVNLSVAKGQCVALLGRNGAGKTTTLRSIMGLTRLRSGEIRFHGRSIAARRTHQIAKAGIAFVPEDRGIFPTVTVDEHLRMALFGARKRGFWTLEYAYELFPKLVERKQSLGGQLSGGEQQMLAVARALLTNPDLLVLDEPSEGLAPIIVERLEDALVTVKRAGIPILLVEQNYHLALRIADQAHVLSQGRVRYSGSATELAADERIKSTYLSI